MAKDGKYKDYWDQVYYELALLALAENNRADARNFLHKSVDFSDYESILIESHDRLSRVEIRLMKVNGCRPGLTHLFCVLFPFPMLVV